MAAAPTQVVIPFHPLLMQITKCLRFPDPVYEFVDEPKNNARVVVKSDCGPIAYVYVGGEAGKLEESCEKAAQKAARDLMTKYGVFVEDVTSNRRQMFGRCAGLYHLKKVELERMEKGAPKMVMHEALCEDTRAAFKHVSVDFMSVLRAVFREIKVCCTPIETIEHSPDQYTSWFTITPHKSSLGFQCIFSDCCPTLAAAKQSLAKKAIDYLMAVYNFEVVDANYNPSRIKFDAVLCTLERESYLTVKERVLGLKEDLEPSLLLVEQDCLTPRGVAFQIPSIASAPLPPKKRKAKPVIAHPSVVAASKSEISLFFSVPSELETVFKRPKFS